MIKRNRTDVYVLRSTVTCVSPIAKKRHPERHLGAHCPNSIAVTAWPGAPSAASNSKTVMQAQLNLAFVHRVAVLLHITRLNLAGLANLIAERRIKSIAIV